MLLFGCRYPPLFGASAAALYMLDGHCNRHPPFTPSASFTRCSRSSARRISKRPRLNFMPTQVGLTDDGVESMRSAGTLCRHRKRPSGGRSHCFGARAAASATSRYNGGFLHMRCLRIKAKLPHPLLVSSAPVRTRAKRANGYMWDDDGWCSIRPQTDSL